MRALSYSVDSLAVPTALPLVAPPPGPITTQGSIARRRPAAAPHSLTLHSINTAERQNVEAFIASVFLDAHGAKLSYFLPSLLSLHSSQGQLDAAVGFRPMDHQVAFLECYLNQAVHSALASAIGRDVQRSHIAEVGNLACSSSGASRALVAALSCYLFESDVQWAVFTGTTMVSAVLRRVGIETVPLARANPLCLGDQHSSWGRYYQHNPKVMAAYIPQAQQAACRKFRYCHPNRFGASQ